MSTLLLASQYNGTVRLAIIAVLILLICILMAVATALLPSILQDKTALPMTYMNRDAVIMSGMVTYIMKREIMCRLLLQVMVVTA